MEKYSTEITKVKTQEQKALKILSKKSDKTIHATDASFAWDIDFKDGKYD